MSLKNSYARMCRAIINNYKINTSGPMQGDGYFCIHCHGRNGEHLSSCIVIEAVEGLKTMED